jgi:C4-dicarboxylate-specific signal transduction histidine kinase
VARPLREQFVLATLILLIPVSAVMTWSAGATYQAQLGQLQKEARVLVSAIARHIEQMGPAGDAGLNAFLSALPVEEGTLVTVADDKGHVIAKYSRRTEQNLEEITPASAKVAGRPLTVYVSISNQIAWWRAEPLYRHTIAISGIATLVLLALEAAFVRRWLPALVQLERTADRVGAGDLSDVPRHPMPSRELEHLRDAFADMVERLRAASQALAAQMEEERQMRHEVESLQRQVIRQERLAAIGVLLSGIAHELNNPLQTIAGFSEILQRDPDLTPQARSDLALIKKESARASAIIRNLSRFSRQQGSTPTVVLPTDVVASVVELRQRRLQEQSIRLELDEAATHPTLVVFTELQQVLMNFLVNAEQSLGAVGGDRDRRILIRTRDTDQGVRLEVEDTGPGVPAEHESKLFQPFFTTKPIGEGTGLGLSVSYGIVRSFGGTIGYRRGDLGGALFYVDLPAAPVPLTAPRPRRATTS